MMCYIDGPIYLTGMMKSKNEDNVKMNITVKINFPSYYENDTDKISNQNNYKNTLESQLEDLFIHNIITERYSRTKLNINLDIYEFNCDIISYAVMAISFALTAASVEQKGILTCANIITVGDNIIVDPTFKEEKLADFKLVFGCIVDLQENNLFLQNGSIDDNLLKKVIEC
jgi:ribonuclease PH